MHKHKLKNSIRVINFDNSSNQRRQRQVEMFPNIMRCGIFGPSGAGKSNILLTILVHVRPFNHVYLCTKTGYQEKYETLRELVATYNKRNCKHGRHSNRGKQNIQVKDIVQVDDLPEPEEIPRGSIVIFDDILTEKQDKIANIFLRGRHRDTSAFYLSQTYTKIPKKSGIRENFNYLILFRQDLVNLRQIFNEYVTDVTFDRFRKMCNECWHEPYGFLVIDVENEKSKYKNKFEFAINS